MAATIDWIGVGLACLVLLVVLVLAGMVLRRRLIARGEPMALVALARGEDGWKLGMTRLTTHDVQWFALVGLGLRPRWVWVRGDLDLGSPEPVAGNRPIAIVDPVQVDCQAGGRSFRIAVARGDYTALRSWSESAPPGRGVNVA
ncbi:DUF2550 domain-containing protein [Flexivirga sp. ID2601S]|uniref:DUF2550 domain-containing protein n=1 Tax=Flexivirga aerilata TaxID=1656889 RepID=A0A849AHH9_9MICO|nr:DUF2550 family protein [Flexivirga aerilata]NNG39317.1 DUF2550 domain-containing protein [Flexivirga aerilata]